MSADRMGRRLAAFVPKTIWPLLAPEPRHSRLEGCVLFADLAGFTPLTENLAKIGKEGAEELTRILNDFFAAMIRVVHEEGGDVVRFGGDAMTLFFPAGAEGGVRAARRMQREAGRFQTIQTRGGTFALGMKIGVSTGPVLFGTVGNDETGRDYFAAGAALDLAAEAEHRASRGQIVLAPQSLPHLKGAVRTLPLEDGFVLLDAAAAPADADFPVGRPAGTLPRLGLLEGFLPAFIVEKVRIADGLSAAEHRRTSVLFVSFQGIDYDRDASAPQKAGEVYLEVARTAGRFGGWVNKMDMGDKGSKAIVLFGAPHALENQEEMACRAALAVLASPTLRRLLSDVRIGVTVSPLFAAYVGSEDRREYTVMGDGINMAARLMASAHSWRAIAGEAVVRQSSGVLAFRSLDPIFVKGKSEKVAIFRPEGERTVEADQRARFVGHGDLLERWRSELSSSAGPAALAVHGEPGVGKSAFLHRLGADLNEMGIRHVTVPLVAHSASSYMAAWKGVLHSVLGVPRTATPETKEAALRLAAPPEDQGYLPLFNPLLGTSLADGDAVRALSAKDRKDVLFAMLARLVLRQADEGPYGIFLDHLEHSDPASLEFMQMLRGELGERPLKLVLALRTEMAASLEPHLAGFERVRLPPLEPDEVRDFAANVSGVAMPSEPFVEFLMKKTGGNPKFIQQMIAVLMKEGVVAHGPSGRLEVDEDHLTTTAFPETLEGLFLARVDTLGEKERSFLKAASVLGPSFSLSLLEAVTEETPEVLLQTLRSLEQKGLVRMDSWGARPYALFVDSLMRDALYESLTFSVRRSQHLKAAQRLEEEGAGSARLWPALAHHYEAAGRDEEAARYLWNAAEDARARFDNNAAFALLGRFVALRENSGADPAGDDVFRKGLLYLAEASKELGRLEEADAYSRRILDAAGSSCPESVVSIMRLADNQRLRGAIPGSMELYGQAMDQALALGDKELQCRILLDSGVPLAMSGRMEEARDRFHQAEVLARRVGAHRALAFALMNQGLCHYQTGNYHDAVEAYKSARRVARQHGLRAVLVTIATNLTQVLIDLGRFNEAVRIAQEGLAASRQFGYRYALVGLQGNLCICQTFLGHWEEAARSAEQALVVARHHHMEYFATNFINLMGVLDAVAGDLERSVSAQLESISTHVRLKNYEQALDCLCEVLILSNQWNLPDLAAEATRRAPALTAEELLEGASRLSLGLRVQYALHRAYAGDVRQEDICSAAEAWAEESLNKPTPWLPAEVGEALVRFLKRSGRADKAVEIGCRILPKVENYYCPLKVGPFLVALSEATESTGDMEGSAQLYEKARRYGPTLDRGLAGVRFFGLAARVAEREGRRKVAMARRNRAREIASDVMVRLSRADLLQAFINLPEVSPLLTDAGE